MLTFCRILILPSHFRWLEACYRIYSLPQTILFLCVFVCHDAINIRRYFSTKAKGFMKLFCFVHLFPDKNKIVLQNPYFKKFFSNLSVSSESFHLSHFFFVSLKLSRIAPHLKQFQNVSNLSNPLRNWKKLHGRAKMWPSC